MVLLGNIQFGITGFPVQRGKRRDDKQGGVRKQTWVRTLEGYDKPGLTLDGIILIIGKRIVSTSKYGSEN